MAYKKVYDDNFEDLTKILPMNDSTFTAKLKTKRLLEGDISEQIETKATKADKAKYFLQNVIESGLGVDDTENFDKFLNVMEKSEHRLLVKRAKKIRSELSAISSVAGTKGEREDSTVSSSDAISSVAGTKRKREDSTVSDSDAKSAKSTTMMAREKNQKSVYKEFDYEAVASQLKKKLNQLTKLNYDAMMGSLIAEDVITDEERKKIAKETGAGKMTYLILDVIIPSLKLKNCKKYRGFLMAMEDSEDGDLVSMAKKLGGSESVPDTLPD